MPQSNDEFKFLLKLMGHDGYRTSIQNLKPTSATTASKRDRICRDLEERGIVDCSYLVRKFSIHSSAKKLLQDDPTQIPLSEQQLMVLKACKDKTVSPSEIGGKKLLVEERQTIIQDLAVKGFVTVKKAEIKEVWLTERGIEYLRDELKPSGRIYLDLSLLENYLSFMRKFLQESPDVERPSENIQILQEEPTDEMILKIIKELDQEQGKDNYLPIFYLREKLQPPMSRDELDKALYRLQRQDKLELSSLVETIHYSSEEIQAGIPQDSGGPLFFLTINE